MATPPPVIENSDSEVDSESDSDGIAKEVEEMMTEAFGVSYTSSEDESDMNM